MQPFETVPVDVVNAQVTRTGELLGGLNEVERKYAPGELHWAGDCALFKKRPRIAVVGSRQVSEDGQRTATAVTERIVTHGGIVVGGLALGVDGIAHRTAMAGGGRTIAVVGTPLDRSYPRDHADLQAEIAEHHLLVSEFPPGQPVQRKNFVLRNRTMALLSHATVIVEAGEKSGTEHQGWEAIRLGRLLFLPRTMAEAPFDWPRKLIGYGALIFEGMDDLAELLDEFLPGPSPVPDNREIFS